MLKTDLWNDDATTLHTLTGSTSEVETEIQKLLQCYPSEGYSTFVQKKNTLPDGNLQAVVFRFNSCD
jgi:hypothetical protein